MPDQPAARGRARVSSARPTLLLDHAERNEWAARFGVAPDQIDRDHAISHLLTAISAQAERIIFYGGTALSRTVLPDLRLSEDIDLLSVGLRRDVAGLLDQAIRDYMEPRFGQVTADPWLASASRSNRSPLSRSDVAVAASWARSAWTLDCMPSLVSCRSDSFMPCR